MSHEVPEVGRDSTLVLRGDGALGVAGGCDAMSHEVPEVGRDSTLVLRWGGGVFPCLSTTTSHPLPDTGRVLPMLDLRRRDAGGDGVGRNLKRNVTSSSSSSSSKSIIGGATVLNYLIFFDDTRLIFFSSANICLDVPSILW
jgi:hypothetical protein